MAPNSEIEDVMTPPPNEGDELAKERSHESQGSGMSGNLLQDEPEDELLLLNEVKAGRSVLSGMEGSVIEVVSTIRKPNSKRKTRRKRGTSLERQISELIRRTAVDADHTSDGEESPRSIGEATTTTLSTDFILQDLVGVESPEPRTEANDEDEEDEDDDLFRDDTVEEQPRTMNDDIFEDLHLIVDEDEDSSIQSSRILGEPIEEPMAAPEPTATAEVIEEAPVDDNLDLHQDPSLTLNITETDDEASADLEIYEDDEEGFEDEEEDMVLGGQRSTPAEVITHVSVPESDEPLAEGSKEKVFSDVESFDSISWKGEEEEASKEAIQHPLSPMDATARQSPATTLHSPPKTPEKVVFKTNFEDWSSNFDDTIDPAEFGANDFFANSPFAVAGKQDKMQYQQRPRPPRVQYRAANSWRKARPPPPKFAESHPPSPDAVYDHPGAKTTMMTTTPMPTSPGGSNRWNTRRAHSPQDLTRIMI